MRVTFPFTGVSFICIALLSGCTASVEFGRMANDEDMAEPIMEPVYQPNPSGFVYTPDARDQEYAQLTENDTGYRDPLQNGFSPSQTHKRLNDYASQLAMLLMEGNNQLDANDLVGVTSFVRLNESLSDSTVLGNQLSEYLIAELQSFGVGIVDFKLANGISVTPVGDFSLSRNAKYIADKLAMNHVVTGTIVEDDRGVRVNARIVSLENKQVKASASVFIPAFVVIDLNHPSVAQNQ